MSAVRIRELKLWTVAAVKAAAARRAPVGPPLGGSADVKRVHPTSGAS